MTSYFCPYCWKILGKDEARCPFCGHDLRQASSYVDKLILALESPDSQTARRAAYLLGLVGDPQVIPVLEKQLAKADPYLAAEAVLALGKISGTEALQIIKRARRHRYVVVRDAVQKIMKKTLNE